MKQQRDEKIDADNEKFIDESHDRLVTAMHMHLDCLTRALQKARGLRASYTFASVKALASLDSHMKSIEGMYETTRRRIERDDGLNKRITVKIDL